MRRLFLTLGFIIAMIASIGLAQHAAASGPYKVLKTVKAGGPGGFDYVHADVAGRRLYIPRRGEPAAIPPVPDRVAVFDPRHAGPSRGDTDHEGSMERPWTPHQVTDSRAASR